MSYGIQEILKYGPSKNQNDFMHCVEREYGEMADHNFVLLLIERLVDLENKVEALEDRLEFVEDK